jgi:hypothetical protein
MSSFPSGLAANQKWGGKNNLAFTINTLPGGNLVRFNIDFVNCNIPGTTGTGTLALPVVTGACAGGSVELGVGDIVKVNEGSTPVLRTIQSLTGSSAAGYSLVFTTALATPPNIGTPVKGTPQGGNMEFVPYRMAITPFHVDRLIAIPRSGDIKLVPQGTDSAFIKKQALKLGTCGSTPDASCFNFGTLSH